MTAVLVVVTILVAVLVDIVIVSLRQRRERVGRAAIALPMRDPVIPRGIFLGSAHEWARLTAEGNLRIGLDDLLSQALGEVDRVTPVPRGTEVKVGETLLRVGVGRWTLLVPSPVDGRVVETNERLVRQPWLLARDPYGAGWCVGVWSRDVKEALRPLRIGSGAAAFLREELGRLADFFTARSAGVQAPVLADGGVPRVGAVRSLDDADWEEFQRRFCRIREEG